MIALDESSSVYIWGKFILPTENNKEPREITVPTHINIPTLEGSSISDIGVTSKIVVLVGKFPN